MSFRLFTVFHGNLDFSALPDRDLPLVISRCYWPLLVLAEEARLPLGIEMPARTLQRIADEDPHWLKAFRGLADRGLVEPVASGWAQVVGPLVPADVNRANLALGRRAYADLLGRVPGTWFVNEQTFSRGLAPLYAEAGAQALVMEWNNPASARPELRALRYRPARLRVPGGAPLPLLWNDCIFFQKLQRTAHGVCPEGELLDAVGRARESEGARLLCVYGGDLEIFDYRPGHPGPEGAASGREMGRLAACLRSLAADPRHRFLLPGEALRDLPPGPEVELASASQPIPCKKQPRYNPTRWAVSGRDGLGMNTQCFALRRELRAAVALRAQGRGRVALSEARDLVELWGSDYRTRATEERIRDFHARSGAAQARVRAALEALAPALGEGADVVLRNTAGIPWRGQPLEIELRLAPGRFERARVLAEPARALPAGASQLEVSSRHRDGSVRCARLVLEPRLDPGEELALRLSPAREAAAPAPQSPARLLTGAVEADFLLHRGGALGRLRFPALGPAPLVGTLPHGSFDTIEYTPDFYTGHAVAVTEAAMKVSDLAQVASARVVDDGPVRTVVEFQTATPLGEWTKLYRLYRHHPRLDLVHVLRFHEARLQSLRLGTLTLLPDAFQADQLAYACVNGGREPEAFRLGPDAVLAQQAPVSPSVSATSCLGASEGWVALGDGRRGVAVIADRALAAAVPLLEHRRVDGRPFLRLHHTIAESDETRATFFRGVARAAFAILGCGADLREVRGAALAIERGLVYRTERGVGIARGL